MTNEITHKTLNYYIYDSEPYILYNDIKNIRLVPLGYTHFHSCGTPFPDFIVINYTADTCRDLNSKIKSNINIPKYIFWNTIQNVIDNNSENYKLVSINGVIEISIQKKIIFQGMTDYQIQIINKFITFKHKKTDYELSINQECCENEKIST